jgi:hypothetical protein
MHAPVQLPMWLEMTNVSMSAIAPNPIRLILKMGDDLRQDMITLRILALFDKVDTMGTLVGFRILFSI